LRVLLTSQDIRILTVQFCTHLLAAGVLRQIPDKDVTLEPLFRVSRQLNNGGRGPSSVSSIPELMNGYLLNLGTAVTSQNRIHEGIKSRLNSGNASHHGLPHVLSSRFLSAKKYEIKIRYTYANCNFVSVVSCVCETWSLTVKDKQIEGV
jgi:hypothetical protein